MNADNGGIGYLGHNNWRLPTTLQPDASCSGQGDVSNGYNCTGSEMGHLFYTELGGTAANPILGSTDPDIALFSNIQSYYYWSGTEYPLGTRDAWDFTFDYGYQLNYLRPLLRCPRGLFVMAMLQQSPEYRNLRHDARWAWTSRTDCKASETETERVTVIQRFNLTGAAAPAFHLGTAASEKFR